MYTMRESSLYIEVPADLLLGLLAVSYKTHFIYLCFADIQRHIEHGSLVSSCMHRIRIISFTSLVPPIKQKVVSNALNA